MWLGANDIVTASLFVWESSGKKLTYFNWDVGKTISSQNNNSL
jgi:hypothetical protein